MVEVTERDRELAHKLYGLENVAAHPMIVKIAQALATARAEGRRQGAEEM